MKTRRGMGLGVILLLALGACAADPETTPSPSAPRPTSTIQDVLALEKFADLEPGTYLIDPDLDPSTALRVVYEVPEGWTQWFGAVKFRGDRHVMVNITTVTNLVTHGCTDHSWQDPPVGPSVDDLATALADLAPFRVTSPPEDVTIYGYRGKHLELTVPDLEVVGTQDDRRFTDCTDGNLMSWVAPIDVQEGEGGAFGAYNDTPPGDTEEFWILDVEGTRLMIVAHRSAGARREDLPELRAILDSIRIEP